MVALKKLPNSSSSTALLPKISFQAVCGLLKGKALAPKGVSLFEVKSKITLPTYDFQHVIKYFTIIHRIFSLLKQITQKQFILISSFRFFFMY